jgi:hypothetical protein
MVGRVLAGVALGALWLVGAVACSAFGSGDEPAEDAGTDSAAGLDALVDGGADEASASVAFCASLDPTPAFCDDFDDSGIDWGTLAHDGGQLRLDDLAVSPPNALYAALPGYTLDEGCAYASQRQILGATAASRIRFEHDLRPGPVNASSYPSFVPDHIMVSDEDGGRACGYYLFASRSGPSLKVETPEGYTIQTLALSGIFLPDRWTRAVIEIEKGEGSPSVAVTLDGASALVRTSLAGDAGAACGFGKVVSISLGIICYRGTADVEVRFDNVLVAVE